MRTMSVDPGPLTTKSVPDTQADMPGGPNVIRHADTVPAGVQSRRDWLAASVMLLTARLLPAPQFREIW
jgi:hypothetical protein